MPRWVNSVRQGRARSAPYRNGRTPGYCWAGRAQSASSSWFSSWITMKLVLA